MRLGRHAVQRPRAAGKPAAERRRVYRHRGGRHPPRQVRRRERRPHRAPVQAGAGGVAGLHRRAGGRGPRGAAQRDGPHGRGPEEDQPAGPLRPRRRPQRAGRRLRHEVRPRNERRTRVRAERRAVRIAPLGAKSLRQLPRRPARDRHRPPGEPGVPGRRGADEGRRRLPGQPRRDGLPHHDDQRAGRRRLGRGRDRGGGRDARPADLHAHPGGRRVRAEGNDAGGGHGDGPRAHGRPDAAGARRGREVRGVPRPRAGRDEPRGPGHDRQHGPGVRGDDGILPRRSGDAGLPPPHRPAGRGRRSGRAVHEGQRPVPHAGDRPPRPTPAACRWTSARSFPAWPARSGRRTGSRSPT